MKHTEGQLVQKLHIPSEFKKILPRDISDRQKLWEDCVSLGKLAVKNFKDIKVYIADLAILACDVSHGGRPRSEFFTIAKFAKEIGLKYTTLSQWVTCKANIDEHVKDEKTREFAISNFGMISHELRYNSGTPIEKQIKAFKTEGRGYRKWRKYIAHLKSMHFNTKHKLAMKDASEEQLIEALHLAREIAFNISLFVNDSAPKVVGDES